MIDALMQNQPSKKDRDHWIYISVGCHLRGRDVLKEPDVGGVSDPGATHNQVENRANAASGPGHVRESFEQHGKNQVPESGEDHLPGGSAEGIGARPLFREYRSERPSE